MATNPFVYVSCAEDGEIRIYQLRSDGRLDARGAAKAEKTLGPLAISPDKRWLVGAARMPPFKAHCYAIDGHSGALTSLGTAPVADSLPYITFDRTGRFLLGASYGANLVCVNPVGADGRVGEPMQVIPTARNAHAIITDRSNRYVFVPHLGTDQVFQFRFDEKSGRLSANTPPLVQLAKGSGPRHIVQSPDGRYLYLLNELTATVSTLALSDDGLLKEVHSVSATRRRTSGPPTSTSRPTAVSSMRRSAPAAPSTRCAPSRVGSSRTWGARPPRSSRAVSASILPAATWW
jgi:6-phosphogluconolactonase